MRIPITEVPLQARRLAAQHLSSVMGTEMAAGLDRFYLLDSVVPVYRPDIDGVAYYEFAVSSGKEQESLLISKGFPQDKLKSGPGSRAADSKAGLAPIGFVVVANGRHDFPVSHWSLNRQPPSLQFAMDDKEGGNPTKPNAAKAARMFRLDTLAYAAEDDSGGLVGQTGQLPAALSGLPSSFDKVAGKIEASTVQLERVPESDEGAEKAEHRLETTMKSDPPLKRDDEGGWKGLKERYADAFGPMLEHLRGRAAKTWELQDLIEKLGEGIASGTTHRVDLLDQAKIELTGEGRKLVESELIEYGDGPPTLLLHAAAEPVQSEQDLNIYVHYGNGERETLKFFIYSRAVPSKEKARNPVNEE
jgi:hypothetical protein